MRGTGDLIRVKERGRKGEQGQAMVEFAFTVPIILITLVALVLISWTLYTFVVLQHATREGAHFAVTNTQATDEEIIAEAMKHIGILDPNNITFTVEGERVEDTYMVVNVTYVLPLPQIYIPYIIVPGGYTFPPLQITARSAMLID